ncbi:FHA domain-containing protein [Amycolatopsis xylanica]|uniref:FHA domain-containing protein n=1 Tax=Amycolatopsis xylanica TaxID=589385 RepID=A0A1H3S083_9PSEU|nr:FHA domain-containing protein [Amycolatopsis xylanica]SDZ31048.1 FHA domain-containing protein [Amycolatopsis xylanica]
MDPITILTGLVAAGAAVSREIREWMGGTRDRIEVAANKQGTVQPLRHDGTALRAPQITTYATYAMLVGTFQPADIVAARRLSDFDQALVLIWPSGTDPAYTSIVFTCDLNGVFQVELEGGTYEVAAYVLDQDRDEFRGTAAISYLNLPWSSQVDLTLAVAASETEHISLLLTDQFGETAAELVLPDGVCFPLGDYTLIGAGENCTLVLPDPYIDVGHAQIRFVNGYYYVEDLGSVNGTAVNGQFVHSQALYHGDWIKLVDWYLQFRLR